MNLPNTKFSTKNYNSNPINKSNINTKQVQNTKPLFKSFNGQQYESFEEARVQNMKVYNSFSNIKRK